MVGGSYAFLSVKLSDEKRKTLIAGELSLEIEEDENNLTLENALPMYDEVGMIQEPFTFRVINNSSVPLNYNDTYGNLLTPKKGDSKFLGWYTSITGRIKIESTTIMNSANNHTLYTRWKDPYVDNTRASRPIVKAESIPVKIARSGAVTKTDIAEKWYD